MLGVQRPSVSHAVKRLSKSRRAKGRYASQSGKEKLRV
jgi:hypothetical protein